MYSKRHDALNRLDELNKICKTCVTIIYNEQTIGEELAHLYCIDECPMSVYFREVGDLLIQSTKEQREKRANEQDVGESEGI